jgi:hypothetical protein
MVCPGVHSFVFSSSRLCHKRFAVQRRAFFLLLAAVSLSACNSTQRYESNRTLAQAWLDTGSARPAANLSGRWRDATDDEWGEANLVQQGGRVSGTLGNYEVDGVVTGARVNLALKSDNWYYYSVAAVVRGGVLEGYYSTEFPPKLVKGKSPPFRFERVR